MATIAALIAPATRGEMVEMILDPYRFGITDPQIIEGALAIVDALEDDELSDPLSHWVAGLPTNSDRSGLISVSLSEDPWVTLSKGTFFVDPSGALRLSIEWDGGDVTSRERFPLLAQALLKLATQN